MSAPDWRALADAVRERRYELALSMEALVEHGGPSHQIVRNIEHGAPGPYRPQTLYKLERALQWPRGHVDRVLAGHPVEGVDDRRTMTVVAEPDTLDWQALGDAVHARRTELRLPQQLIGHGGPGEMTMRKIERGETTAIRPRTKVQLERALGWPRGHVDRVLAGLPAEVETVIAVRDTRAVHDLTTAEAVDDAHALRVGRLVLELWRELAAVEDGAGSAGIPSRSAWHS